jgi:hypothetical protein
MELSVYHPSETKNSEVAPRFVGNLLTPGLDGMASLSMFAMYTTCVW